MGGVGKLKLSGYQGHERSMRDYAKVSSGFPGRSCWRDSFEKAMIDGFPGLQIQQGGSMIRLMIMKTSGTLASSTSWGLRFRLVRLVRLERMIHPLLLWPWVFLQSRPSHLVRKFLC